jgi:hypothetical protein
MAIETPVKTKRIKKGKRDGGILAPGGGGGGGWNGDENSLLEAARDMAVREGYTLGPDFESEFLRAVRSRDVAEDQDHTTEEAIRNVGVVVSKSISLVGEHKILDGETFRMSLRDLCPIWPFCR